MRDFAISRTTLWRDGRAMTAFVHQQVTVDILSSGGQVSPCMTERAMRDH